MSIALGLWIAAAPIIGLVWLVRFIFMGVMLRGGDILGSRSYLADTNEQGTPWNGGVAPRLTVFVAAKDEQNNIEACVTSLLDQDYPNFEVIVIDDRSRDRTPDILRDLKNDAEQPSNSASGDARAGLRVVTLQDLPDGWFGKSHAMHKGFGLSS
ncbi:MAG: glycosyltransferase, partial [Planctomycetes bacterium]|nr:glycosyltransferase [Planctomycetota bacterium]